MQSAAGSLAVLSAAKVGAAARMSEVLDSGAPGGPVVISTWNFGQGANAAAWKILESGGRALDAVEAGVRVCEADPDNQTVGYGGHPDRDGHVTLDACIMDENFNCGSVMCLTDILHPISVARLVMEKTPHIVLTGEGALRFALENGFKKQNLLTPKSEKAWKEWLKKSNYEPVMNIENRDSAFQPVMPSVGPDVHDTIGMVALDAAGNLSGACTTSGLAYKMHGRVGDSPIIGAAMYVDNEVGAATATGVGEEVIRIVGAHTIIEAMRSGMGPEAACRHAIERIVRASPNRAPKVQVGFLAVNKAGETGAWSLQKGFTYALRRKGVDELRTSPYHFH